MRGRKPDLFELKRKDKVALQQLLRDGHTPLRVARPAQILLRRTDARQRVKSLGEIVEQNTATIWQVCERYRLGGLDAAFYDAPRSGRPRVFFQKRSPGD